MRLPFPHARRRRLHALQSLAVAAWLGIFLPAAVACSHAVTQPTRIVPIEPGRRIELTVGERVRIDAPNQDLRWSLGGRDAIVLIEPNTPDRPSFWTVIAITSGATELTLSGQYEPTCATPADCPPPPAPPSIILEVLIK